MNWCALVLLFLSSCLVSAFAGAEDDAYCLFFDADGVHPGVADHQGYDGDFFRFDGKAYQAEVELYFNQQGLRFLAVAKRDDSVTQGNLNFSEQALMGFNFEVGSEHGSVGSVFCGRKGIPRR